MTTLETQDLTLLTWIPGGDKNPADIHTRSELPQLKIANLPNYKEDMSEEELKFVASRMQQ